MKKIYVTLLTIAMMTLLMSCGSASSSSESDGSEYEAYIAELENENESLSNYAEELAEYSDELISAGDEMLEALESISAENDELKRQLEASDIEEGTTVNEGNVYTYDVLIYSDEYIDIYFANSTYGAATFEVTNKCEGVMDFSCDYISLDGEEYSYDDTGERSAWSISIASGDTRKYTVIMLNADTHEEIPETAFSTILGAFYMFIDGTDISESISVSETSLK